MTALAKHKHGLEYPMGTVRLVYLFICSYAQMVSISFNQLATHYCMLILNHLLIKPCLISFCPIMVLVVQNSEAVTEGQGLPDELLC